MLKSVVEYSKLGTFRILCSPDNYSCWKVWSQTMLLKILPGQVMEISKDGDGNGFLYMTCPYFVKFSHDIQPEPLCFQLKPIASCTSSINHCEEPGPVFWWSL